MNDFICYSARENRLVSSIKPFHINDYFKMKKSSFVFFLLLYTNMMTTYTKTIFFSQNMRTYIQGYYPLLFYAVFSL
jgi:hypothetical protein